MGQTQTEFNPPPPPAALDTGNQGYEESPAAEEDLLQDYCQQAILSDGLQRIDEWTYVVQDWDKCLAILEVSLLVVCRNGAEYGRFPANQVLPCAVFANN